jgi:hypothetical protein
MTEWKQGQKDQWSNNYSEYSDEDEEYSDDEYAPIEATSWGNQTITPEGTTNVEVSLSGWQSLIDPNIKVKAGGIGSGQLHRKGGNFIPVDEQTIIDRRLGKPVPKATGPKATVPKATVPKATGSKKKKGSKSKAKGATNPPPPRRPVPSSMVPPSSSHYRGREAIATGPWASAELSSQPFWEQPRSAESGTNASKWATPDTAAAPPPQKPTYNARPAAVTAPPPSRPAANSYHTSAQSPQTQTQAAPATPTFVPTSSGSAASKWATPDAAAAVAAHPPPPPPNQQQQQQQHRPPPSDQQYQPPTIYHRLDTPCLNFNIELTPGVNATLAVYENDDPVDIVDQFEKKHHLTMSSIAKEKFAQKVAMLLSHYKSS